ncbi:hypothetical protein EDD17DRAFT_1575537, partial [Pisolithus thermaeus]
METVAQAVWLLQVVPAALMVYDCVLSLDDEVEYIWKKQFSFISVIYVIFRYLGTIYTLISTVDFIANENTTKSVGIPQINEYRASLTRITSVVRGFYSQFVWPQLVAQLF